MYAETVQQGLDNAFSHRPPSVHSEPQDSSVPPPDALGESDVPPVTEETLPPPVTPPEPTGMGEFLLKKVSFEDLHTMRFCHFMSVSAPPVPVSLRRAAPRPPLPRLTPQGGSNILPVLHEPPACPVTPPEPTAMSEFPSGHFAGV
jgi:hypothetical protein